MHEREQQSSSLLPVTVGSNQHLLNELTWSGRENGLEHRDISIATHGCSEQAGYDGRQFAHEGNAWSVLMMVGDGGGWECNTSFGWCYPSSADVSMLLHAMRERERERVNDVGNHNQQLVGHDTGAFAVQQQVHTCWDGTFEQIHHVKCHLLVVVFEYECW
jgi:hypothetical protein